MALLIEITHPRRRTVRLELEAGGDSVGLSDERVERVAGPGRGRRDARLAFMWRNTVEHVSWFSQPDRTGFFSKRVDLFIDGEPVRPEQGTLRPGQRLHWRDFTVELLPRTELTRQALEQAEHARTHSEARLVFADEAEARGEVDFAAWIRAVESNADAMTLRALAEPVPARLRALFTRARIEACGRCEGAWERLPIDAEEDPQSRRCGQCSKRVRLIEHTDIEVSGPHALCPSTGRTTDDRYPYGVIG